MRVRALVLTFASTAFATALLLASCSQSSSPTAVTPPTDGATSADPTAPGTGTTAAADTAAPSDPGDPSVDITNDPPDGGVAMNNATTASDAGASDRLMAIMQTVQTGRDKFRACFDKWGKGNPGSEVKVTLSIKLRPTGELTSATFKPDETDIADKAVETCMADVAKTLKFPASPTGKDTTYNHRFNFKSK